MMARFETSRLLSKRSEFGLVCDLFGYQVGVEIGVDRGEFSSQLLAGSKYLFLYCVDPWVPYPEISHDRSEAKSAAADALAPFVGRYAVIETTSQKAAGAIPAPIDFVHIDGAHDYQNVLLDLKLWWSRIKPGGMLSGHDFDTVAVRAALNSVFIWQTVFIVPEPPDGTAGIHPSWYVLKS